MRAEIPIEVAVSAAAQTTEGSIGSPRAVVTA